MSGPDMSTDTVAKGLAAFLSDTFGRPVTTSNLVASSAGARRGNILFDAQDGDRTLGLVATILPTSEIEINPITAEAAIRDLAEQHGVPVPHIHAVCTDPAYVGGPFFLSTRVDGESVPRRVLRLVHAEGIGELVAEQLGEALGHLHAIDPALGPKELAGDEGGNPAATALAEIEVTASTLVPNRPAFALGLRWLERHLPGPPAGATLVHSDVRNGNLDHQQVRSGRRARLGGITPQRRPDAGRGLAGAAHVALP